MEIDWLRTYEKVTFDYHINYVTFIKDGKQFTLKEIIERSKLKSTMAELQSITATQWYKDRLKGNCCTIGHLENLRRARSKEEIPSLVREVLVQYSEVFLEPKGLPPNRPQDH